MKNLNFLFVLLTISAINVNAQFRVLSNGEARLWTNNMGPWDNTMITFTNHSKSKAYVVERNGTHNFYVRGDGNCYSKGYHTISDIRSKENIDTIKDALEKIKFLNGIKFNYKQFDNPPRSLRHSNNDSINVNKPVHNRESGFIAQEVEKILPEAIDTLENGYKTINYDALIPLLVEAIKEQQANIKTLQTIVNSQEQDLISLKNKYKECCNIKPKLKKASNNISNTNNEPYKDYVELFQNTPNPFTSDTQIDFYIPKNTEKARLIIHNMQGVEVKTYSINNCGKSSIIINGSTLTAGMYLYSLLVDDNIIDTKRMLLTNE